MLRKSEEDALLAQINCKGSAKATAEAVKLPDHMWHCQTMMITRRKGPQPSSQTGISLSSSKKYMPGMSRKKRNQKLYRQQQRRKAKALKAAEANAKEKFNLVEEFFICLEDH